MGGSRPGRRSASIVLPLPGGPASNRLWPPEAQISRARLAKWCDRTSARSGCAGVSGRRIFLSLKRSSAAEPLRWSQTERRCRAGNTGNSLMSPASAAFCSGSTRERPVLWMEYAQGSTPPTGLNSPARDSSPINSWDDRASRGTWPVAARIPTAMARSYLPPCFGRSAGARFTVIRRIGNSK